ncbi:MAG: type II toxin-antitoxin system HigA family antitoxin [Pleurocapsa sp.]
MFKLLLQTFPPRTIKSDEELDKTVAVIDELLDRPFLSSEESDYLNVLGTLVYDYEQKTEPVPDLYGVELLKVLIAERGLLQKDLVPIFKTESIVSDILNGKRQLTVRHIQELAQFFKLSPAVFLRSQRSSRSLHPSRDNCS